MVGEFGPSPQSSPRMIMCKNAIAACNDKNVWVQSVYIFPLFTNEKNGIYGCFLPSSVSSSSRLLELRSYSESAFSEFPMGYGNFFFISDDIACMPIVLSNRCVSFLLENAILGLDGHKKISSF